MKYFVKGSGRELDLTDKMFCAEGGEGKVYLYGDKAYKIYHEPKKVLPLDKFDELQKLTQDNIVKPIEMICDKNGILLGYSMMQIRDTVALCKLFTNDFQNRFSISQDMITKLVERIAKDTSYIHSNGFIIVDGNEMNYLVDMKSFEVPYFIDVDSWQTPSFPATAIMASIRDHHSPKFSEMTDWFSFAVIATQLFVGMHPYKGTHPDYKKSDMEGRMKANVSIFNKDVRLPSASRPIDGIPSAYKEWLIRVLEKGERLAPPIAAGAVIAIAPRVAPIVASNQFIMELIKEYCSVIKKCQAGHVLLSDRVVLPNGSEQIVATSGVDIVESPVSSTAFFAYCNDSLKFSKITQNSLSFRPIDIKCTDMMVSNNTIFVKNDDRLMEVRMDEMGTTIITSVKQTWSVLPNATKLFNGLVYQNVLGVPYFMVFYRLSNGKTACYQFQAPELKGYQVLEAKYENRIAMVIAVKNGKYDNFIFKFSESVSEHKLTVEQDITFHVPNFTVLENGVCVRITPDDDVHVFSNRIDRPDVRVISDPAVTFDMKVAHIGSQVVVSQGKKLYKFSMRK